MPNFKLIAAISGCAIIAVLLAYLIGHARGHTAGYDACETAWKAEKLKQAEVITNVQEKDRQTKERVEKETNIMPDSAIDADLRRLGIMRPNTGN